MMPGNYILHLQVMTGYSITLDRCLNILVTINKVKHNTRVSILNQ